MKITKLIEARRNSTHPSQKRSTRDTLFDKYKNMTDEEISDLYVSFTDINKIGINPQSAYNTPIGVYTYPMKHVLRYDITDDLPFAGDRKNVWVVRSTVSELYLEDYDSLERDIKKAKSYLTETLNVSESHANTIINNAIKDSEFSNNLDASRMWNIARMVAKFMDSRSNSNRKESKSDKKGHDTVYFNTILRKVFGYRVIVDNGLGIIHSNEPNQAVFLDTSSFEVVEKLNQSRKSLTSREQDKLKQLLNDDNIVVLSVKPVIRVLDVNQNIGQRTHFETSFISRNTGSLISDPTTPDSVVMHLYGGIITGHDKNFQKFKSFVNNNKDAFIRSLESEVPYYMYDAVEKVARREDINEEDPNSIKASLVKDLKSDKFNPKLSRVVSFILDFIGEGFFNKLVDDAVETYISRRKSF